ncbi:MAG: hypothetical protein Q4Q23_05100 [Methanobacteriaceae archaeon]|nr:hypothetical protein [Methanobacteriaceae archaeon]
MVDTNNEKTSFIEKAEKEIKSRCVKEEKNIKKLDEELKELERSNKGYSRFLKELDEFLEESMNDFNVSKEDLGPYFRRNINEVFQSYLNIKEDAITEINVLNNFKLKKDKQLKETLKTQKFFRSQYLDSDFFTSCLPLVELYQKEIDTLNDILKLLSTILQILKEIVSNLKSWD